MFLGAPVDVKGRPVYESIRLRDSAALALTRPAALAAAPKNITFAEYLRRFNACVEEKERRAALYSIKAAPVVYYRGADTIRAAALVKAAAAVLTSVNPAAPRADKDLTRRAGRLRAVISRIIKAGAAAAAARALLMGASGAALDDMRTGRYNAIVDACAPGKKRGLWKLGGDARALVALVISVVLTQERRENELGAGRGVSLAMQALSRLENSAALTGPAARAALKERAGAVLAVEKWA